MHMDQVINVAIIQNEIAFLPVMGFKILRTGSLLYRTHQQQAPLLYRDIRDTEISLN